LNPLDPPVLGEEKKELGDTPKPPAASCCIITFNWVSPRGVASPALL
jgi:hypothetical protein